MHLLRFSRDRHRSVLGAALLAVTAMWTSCSAARVRTDVAPDYDFASVRSYAWTRDTGRPEEGAERVADRELADRIRTAVSPRLEAVGVDNVAEDDADVLLRQRATVVEEVQENDPYFAFYTVERYEVGTITIEILDRESGAVVWSGSGRRKLRDVARGTGLNTVRYRETEAERDWQAEAVVAEILADCPLAAPRAGS